ncbi:hypothetical protein MJD09_02685, partial [bacterium]|nr:hypothetical protein [bacterium]
IMLNNEYVAWGVGICVSCLAFANSWLWLIGAFLILVAGLITPTVGGENPNTGKQARPPADLSWFPINIDAGDGSVSAKAYRALMNLFKPGTYLLVTRFVLKIIKWFLAIKGNEFNYWRVFKRLLIFYLIAIPYPAAFLAPVGYKQAEPNLQLMTAGLVFILANVLGDLVSSRITIWHYNNAIERFSALEKVGIENHFKEGTKLEFYLYLTTLRDLLAAVVVLCCVLSISNVMYGIQVGLYSFGTDAHTLGMMWHRATQFWELANQLYWFRGPDGIPEPGKGVPGMFIYGITTFLPTLLMLISALVWTFTIPMRVVLQLPESKLYRIVAGELSVIAVCIAVTGTFNLQIQNIYSFFITI